MERKEAGKVEGTDRQSDETGKTSIEIGTDLHEFLKSKKFHDREPFDNVLRRLLKIDIKKSEDVDKNGQD